MTRTTFLYLTRKFTIFIVYQFIGEFVGVIVGFYFGALVFKGFDIEFKPLILGVVFLFLWNLTNFKIAPQHYPSAQRLGSLIGISIMTIAYL